MTTSLVLESPARLHFGLFNTSGLYGRVNGGAGIAVERPSWRFRVVESNRGIRVTGLAGEYFAAVEDFLCSIYEETGRAFLLIVEARVDAHVGLGAKTSLLMGVAEGLRQLGVRLPSSTRELGTRVGRGGTSGIGVQTSLLGGVAFDFGHSLHEGDGFSPSSRATRRPAPGVGGILPADIKVIHFRFDEEGSSGIREQAIFDQRCPTTELSTQELLAAWYGLTLPALLSGDDHGIQDGISRMQDTGFKRAEWETQGTRTLRFRSHFRETCPDIALGLSSMGPTMYCITNRSAAAIRSLRDFGVRPLHLEVTRPALQGVHEISGKGTD